MKIQTKMIMLATLIIASCTAPAPEEKKETGQVKLSIIDDAVRNDVVKALKDKYGVNLASRIEKGVVQAANFWNPEDGTAEEFKTFCLDDFIATDEELDLVFNRLSAALESLGGCYNKISVDLKLPLHLDIGPIHAVDEILTRWACPDQRNWYANRLLHFTYEIPSLGRKVFVFFEFGRVWEQHV